MKAYVLHEAGGAENLVLHGIGVHVFTFHIDGDRHDVRQSRYGTTDVDVAEGWYHVTARGIERRSVFTDRRDHEHFLELQEEAVERFRIVIHAHVKKTNHYHWVTRTPDTNLSRAMQTVLDVCSVPIN